MFSSQACQTIEKPRNNPKPSPQKTSRLFIVLLAGDFDEPRIAATTEQFPTPSKKESLIEAPSYRLTTAGLPAAVLQGLQFGRTCLAQGVDEELDGRISRLWSSLAQFCMVILNDF